MAKQRRPPPRSVNAQPQAAPARPAGASNAEARTHRPTAPAPAVVPQRRSTYFEAVAVYERGLEALQRHDYRGAIDLLESVLRQYPEERELHERVRLYLNICQRQATPREASPQTIDERLYAATLAINGGPVRSGDRPPPARAGRGSRQRSRACTCWPSRTRNGTSMPKPIAHLERAIALNPENRALARTDPRSRAAARRRCVPRGAGSPTLAAFRAPPPLQNAEPRDN